MIIINDQNPKESIYFIGAIILEIMNKYKVLDFDILYEYLQREINEVVDIDLFYYSLDWLYILSLINIDSNKVKLCL